MKIGVLEFRYGKFANFAERLKTNGYYTINAGDFIQSLAVESILNKIGVAKDAIARIDRESISEYEGPAIKVIMNACFYTHSFPIPDQITPIFIGFQTSSEALIKSNIEYFKRHQPIGCRDNSTRTLFHKNGIEAYTTGCLTMSLARRETTPTTPAIYFIGGDRAGEIPHELKTYIPPQIAETSTHIYQRVPVTSFPVNDADMALASEAATKLMERYRNEATLVVTPLLHAAGPCIAMGIPVIIARKDYRDRFTAISKITSVHTPKDFERIDWNPAPIDIEPLKRILESLLNDLITDKAPSEENRRFLVDFYENSMLNPKMTEK